VHRISLANLAGEFADIVTTDAIVRELAAGAGPDQPGPVRQ
jgi:isochorismate hydrolase